MTTRRTITPCQGKHARQAIVTRDDGSRAQVCLRCNAVIAVLIPAHQRQWTDAELRAEATRRHQRGGTSNPQQPGTPS